MPNPLLHHINVTTSILSSTLALWRGTSVAHTATAPRKRLRLYDMEGCPYCRAVREALTALALDADILPCPKGGGRFRAEAAALSGKMQFPLLVDPNTDTVLHESADIVDYLFHTYGHCATPVAYQPRLLNRPASHAASLLRGLRGLHYRRARVPKKMLALWSFESSPYSRLVRERLTELELPYVLHNLGKEQMADMGPATMRLQQMKSGGSYTPKKGGKREKVLARHGRVQVPYLEDPNTGAKLYESAAIIEYLEREYALAD